MIFIDYLCIENNNKINIDYIKYNDTFIPIYSNNKRIYFKVKCDISQIKVYSNGQSIKIFNEIKRLDISSYEIKSITLNDNSIEIIINSEYKILDGFKISKDEYKIITILVDKLKLVRELSESLIEEIEIKI
ncbi:hypothetical protein A0H76_2381 [Hepatospora eriocheir]|uniref:Uncharacterized protein n=1 Tax=Hepatospora eriocheir TaxID=1081669 RepID=A0A1X0QLE4_9MICR|nr:hypothetical protein A0H76_2381 [Hepatospora eriocheir]